MLKRFICLLKQGIFYKKLTIDTYPMIKMKKISIAFVALSMSLTAYA